MLVLQPRRRSGVGALVVRAASKDTYEEFFSAAPVERFRLNNLSPQPGARKADKRKGRGYGSGQVRLYWGICLIWVYQHGVVCPNARLLKNLQPDVGSQCRVSKPSS